MPDATQARVEASTRPLQFLCLGMMTVGVFLTLQHLGGFFDQWRARGISTFEQGVLDPRFSPVVATMEGILGGSLVGKWSAAGALLRWGKPNRHAWAWRALAGGLVVFGGFEAFVIWSAGIPFEQLGPELLSPLLIFVMLWRLRPPASAATAPNTITPRTQAWRALEAFAWLNVALGLVLGYALLTSPFAAYREAMSASWFEGSVLPHALVPWLHYGYGSIGAVFAAQFFMLAMVMRHAAGRRWALVTYAGTVFAWFVVDTSACLAHGAIFNIWMVNLPALLASLVLCGWAMSSATRSAPPDDRRP